MILPLPCLSFPAFGFHLEDDIQLATQTNSCGGNSDRPLRDKQDKANRIHHYNKIKSATQIRGESHIQGSNEPLIIERNRNYQELQEHVTLDAMQNDRAKAAAYLPLLVNNILIGVLRMLMAINSKQATPLNRVVHFIRGLMECFCLGPLLLIIDLIVTAVRKQFLS